MINFINLIVKLHIKYENKIYDIQLDFDRSLTFENILNYIRDVVKLTVLFVLTNLDRMLMKSV